MIVSSSRRFSRVGCIICGRLDQSCVEDGAHSLEVVGNLLRAWNSAEGISLDLFGFVCLDVVPYNWHQEPSDERYPLVRAQLMESMKTLATLLLTR